MIQLNIEEDAFRNNGRDGHKRGSFMFKKMAPYNHFIPELRLLVTDAIYMDSENRGEKVERFRSLIKELMRVVEEIVGVQREEVQSVVAELRRDFSQGYEKAVEREETRFESKQVLMREFSCPGCGETVSVREDNLYD